VLVIGIWGIYDVFRLCKEKTEDGKRRFDQIVIESTGERGMKMLSIMTYCRLDRMHIHIILVEANNNVVFMGNFACSFHSRLSTHDTYTLWR
jgi:hypothetical protein